MILVLSFVYARDKGNIMFYFNHTVEINKVKAYVQLVLLGFDVTTFTPIAYQGHRL